tara:strand:+ start:201 stop:1106 length:906 start_codon:yes stop_codon:yes gene_type:complete
MNEGKTQQYSDLDLTEILSIIFRYRVFIFSLTFLSSTILLIVLLFIPNKYSSEALFYTSSDPGSTSSSMSSLSALSTFGGLAGISLPANDVAAYDISEARIKSRNFLEILISQEEIKNNLYAANGFDFEKKQITYNQKLLAEKSPDIDDIHKKYINMLDVSRNKTSGIMKINFEHYSPYFAADMINVILKILDKISREESLKEIEDSLSYLEEKRSNTKESELQNSINALIKSNLERLMLANIREEYLIIVISDPYIPKYKSSPPKTLILIISSAAILFLSILLCLVFNFLKKDSQKKIDL